MSKSTTAGPKPLSKSEIASRLAEMVGITRKQATQFLAAQAELAYKHARDQFTIPGIGKLVLVDRAARVVRNPATKLPMQVPAKRVLKFRVAKAAKDAILGAKS